MADIVDDLQSAEDRMGLLEHVLSELLDSPLMPPLDKVPVSDDEKAYESAVRQARLALAFDDYCRPTCNFLAEGECENDDPDCCGCPCGHEER